MTIYNQKIVNRSTILLPPPRSGAIFNFFKSITKHRKSAVFFTADFFIYERVYKILYKKIFFKKGEIIFN